MIRLYAIAPVASLCFVLILGGCQTSSYKGTSTYGGGDASGVTIYRTIYSTPNQVNAEAQNHCAKFGKVATKKSCQSFLTNSCDYACFTPSSPRSVNAGSPQSEDAVIDQAIKRYDRVAFSISLDQSKEEVLKILSPTQEGLGQYGKPSEAFKLDGKTIEIYYMRSARIPDGATTDDEFVPYSFVDGKLTAIGWRSLGGAKTYGDAGAADRRNVARQQLLLGVMGLQQQQNQFQTQQQEKLRRENRQKMDKLLSSPPKKQVNCRTQYFGNSSRTVCN